MFNISTFLTPMFHYIQIHSDLHRSHLNILLPLSIIYNTSFFRMISIILYGPIVPSWTATQHLMELKQHITTSLCFKTQYFLFTLFFISKL